MPSSLRLVSVSICAMLALSSAAFAESCDLFGRLKSKNSNSAITLTFVNKTDALRNVTWLDFKGKPVDYAQLQPGEKFTINTFLTHPWMFTDGPGNCHEIYLPKKGVKNFRITVERQDLGDE
jgi:VHL beta domain